jgi:hypothetical protein
MQYQKRHQSGMKLARRFGERDARERAPPDFKPNGG